MAVPSFWGDEFLVNSTTASDQYNPHVIAFDDGRFAVAFGDGSGDNGVSGSFGDRVDARIRFFGGDGSPLGGDASLGSGTALHSLPAAAALEDGLAAVVWSDFTLDASNSEIRVRLYGWDNQPVGPDVQVNGSTPAYEEDARVAGLRGGGFVVVWTTDAYDGSGGDIRAQMFDRFGNPMGLEIPVTTAAEDQDLPTVTGLDDGGFVIAWRDASGQDEYDDDLSAIRIRRFDSTGYPVGPDQLVNTTTVGPQTRPAVTTLAGGGYVVTWTDYSADYGGSPDGDTDWGAVRGQSYDAAGNAVGDEFRVNAETALDQMNPQVTALPDGGLLVVWVDGSRLFGAEGFDIRARAFAADGTPRGDEVVVNQTLLGPQVDPSVATLPDGRVVVTWTDEAGDGSGEAVRGRILDPRTAGVTVVGTVFDDRYYGSVQADVLAGGDGNDSLYGGDGNDSLYGGDGADELRGGAGDDYYVVDDAQDAAVETQDEGLDRVASSVSYTLPDQVEQLVLLGSDGLVGTGNAIANRLTGNAGANTLFGLGGRDRLDGMGGDDVLIGGSHGDSLFGGEGNDVLDGGSSGDRLFGGDGNDRLYGGSGGDTMTGGAGDDYYVVDDALDIVVEADGGGRDRVASSISLTLGVHLEELALLGTADLDGTGTALGNRLTGNAGANRLRGLDGDDRIEGGAGDDILEGGLGRDVLRGGDGRDAFVFVSTADSPSRAASDTIRDFVSGQDAIDLSAIDAVAATAGFDDAFVLDDGGTFEAGELRQRQEGAHWIIEAETDGDGIADLVIVIANRATTLGEADLLL